MSVGVDGAPIGMLPRTSNVPAGRHQAGRSAGGSGQRGRPVRSHSASSSGLSGVGAVGVKLLTRMPYGARSIAAARTKLLTPPLWNAYAITPAEPDQPLDEEIATIEPRMPRSAMCRPTYLVLR